MNYFYRDRDLLEKRYGKKKDRLFEFLGSNLIDGASGAYRLNS